MLTLQKVKNPLFGEKIYKTISNEQSLSTIPIAKLKKSINTGNIFTIKNNAQSIGFVEIFQFNPSWLGIFSFYIKKQYRHKHFGTKVMKTILKYFRFYNIYLATVSPYMKKICINLGFKITDIKSLPPIVISKLIYKRINTKTKVFKLLRMKKTRFIIIFIKFKFTNF